MSSEYSKKVSAWGNSAIASAVQQVEAELGARGRVLLRPSGTEPVLRVMVEGEDASDVARLAEQLAQAVRDVARDQHLG